MDKAFALRINDSDNVAVVLSEGLAAGGAVGVRMSDGSVRDLAALEPVAYGHKIAVAAIAPGERIVKYGEVIGQASAPIREGEHVHVHNMESLRARGDLARPAKEAKP